MRAYWPLIVVAVLGTLIVILAEPVSKWIGASHASHETLGIGHLTRAIGTVHRVHGADNELIALPVKEPIELRDGDRIETGAAAKCYVNLNSQDEIEINSESAVEFQLWNPKDAGSPIYINSLAGSLNSLRPGVKGKAYVVKDGRLYLPGQTPLLKAMALTVLRNAPLDLHLNETPQSGAAEF
ncbi:MAG: hypothetical protein ACXVA9_08285, partial [Bdellovibrionales bacterium]